MVLRATVNVVVGAVAILVDLLRGAAGFVAAVTAAVEKYEGGVGAL